jgi:hypothetical protein
MALSLPSVGFEHVPGLWAVKERLGHHARVQCCTYYVLRIAYTASLTNVFLLWHHSTPAQCNKHNRLQLYTG